MAINLYSNTLNEAINASEDRESHFIEEKFFEMEMIQTPVVSWDVITKVDGSVSFAGYDGEAVPVDGDTFEAKTVAFDCLRICDTITPRILSQRLPGRTEFDTDDKVAELENLSLEKLNRAYSRARELMAADVIKTGVTSIKRPNGASVTLYSETAKTAALTGNEWNAVGANKDAGAIVRDIVAWKRTVGTNGGAIPDTLLLGYEAAEYLLEQFTKQGAPTLAQGASATSERYASEKIDYIGRVAGVDIYSCADSNILGSKNAIIGSKGMNKYYYGPTFVKAGDMIAQVDGKLSMMTEASGNPVGYINILQGAPLPVLRRPGDVYYITGVMV